jgi:hypothetical protein
MQARTKSVEISGKKFELRRLPPEAGSFILMRMMGVNMRDSMLAADTARPGKPATIEAGEPTKIDGETKVRALAFHVFSGGIKYEDFRFIQQACMKCVSQVNSQGLPIPVLMDSGEWVPVDGESLDGDVGLVMRLTSDVLVFCFSDFFDSGGTGF